MTRRLTWGCLLTLSACLTACGGSRSDYSSLEFPGGQRSAQARLTSDIDGTPILSWLEPDGDETVLRYARLGAAGFETPVDVVSSERMFINWADFPSVTPIDQTLWFAHWLERAPDSAGAYHVATMISRDAGVTWTAAEQMNEDSTEAEHGFVSVFEWDGAIAGFWLDGRELANWSFDDPDALLGVSLRLARYDSSGRVEDRRIVDELVCDCCQPDVAIAESGPIVVYRDRTEDEIRDVVVRRFVDGDWSAPANLGNEGWEIAGCPVNGPVIAAEGRDVVAAWYTAPDGFGRVRFARSRDAGASFAPAIDVDADGAYGQPGIVLDADGRAVVSWWRRSANGGIDLVARSYDVDGTASVVSIVAHETVASPVDVPQVVPVGDQYLFAWTTFDDGGSVRVAVLDL